MKKTISLFSIVVVVSFMLSSCYTYTVTVGKGPQSNTVVTEMNHYLIYGLAPVAVSDAKTMIGEAENYSVTITHTFIDGLLAAITGGIYTPTTTIVTK